MKKVQKYDLYVTVDINGGEYHSTNIIYSVEEYKQSKLILAKYKKLAHTLYEESPNE